MTFYTLLEVVEVGVSEVVAKAADSAIVKGISNISKRVVESSPVEGMKGIFSGVSSLVKGTVDATGREVFETDTGVLIRRNIATDFGKVNIPVVEKNAIQKNYFAAIQDTERYATGIGKVAEDSLSTINTPYGKAVQSTSNDALQLRQFVSNRGELYRGGTFGRSNVTDAQFWSPENPLNPGYTDRYGVDFSKVDYVIGGKQMLGTPYITRPAPALGSNIGGGLEIVNNPNSVSLDFFYMP